MKNLKQKILTKVYSYETKRTTIEIFIRLISIIFLSILLITLVYSFIEQIIQQQTLDVFQLFSESSDIIKENINDIIVTLYYEVSQTQVFIIVLCAAFLFLFVLAFLNNKKRILNSVKSLVKYWKKYTN